MSRFTRRPLRMPARLATVGVTALLAVTLAGAASPTELWAVNEADKSFSRISTASETFIGKHSLAGGFPAPVPNPIPTPYGIAFDTLPTGTQLVFISQGPYLRVVEFATRQILRTINLQPAVPSGYTLRTLKGLAAARTIEIPATPNPETAVYLHVAGNVETPGGAIQPWYFVLDQEALACPSAPCPQLVVASAALMNPSTAGREAVDVSVLGQPWGRQIQRAWYTVKEAGTPPQVHAIQVARRVGGIVPAWDVVQRQARTLSGLTTAPFTVQVATPLDQETAILGIAGAPAAGATNAIGGSGLQSLLTLGCCSIGGVLGPATISGGGSGEFEILGASTSSTMFGTDAPGRLTSTNSATCAASTWEVQELPVDIAVNDPVAWTKAYVLNRGSDTVSIVTKGSSVVRHVPLQSSALGALLQPTGVALQQTSCSVTMTGVVDLDADGDTRVDDVRVSWESSGCVGQPVTVQCACVDPVPSNCPSGCPASSLRASSASASALDTIGLEDCVPGLPPDDDDEDPDTGTDWEPIGTPPAGNGFFDHINAGSSQYLVYSVFPSGI